MLRGLACPLTQSHRMAVEISVSDRLSSKCQHVVGVDCKSRFLRCHAGHQSRASLAATFTGPRAALEMMLPEIETFQPAWHVTSSGATAVAETQSGQSAEIYNEAWKTSLEDVLQLALIDMMPVLNQSCRLHWDFTIYDKATLNKSRPDGHARGHEGVVIHNLFEQAVLFEVKIPAMFRKGIGESLCLS